MDKRTIFGLIIILMAAFSGFFIVTNQPRTDEAGGSTGQTPVGREVTLTLYFANSDASGVAPETRVININGEGPVEELVIRELIAGSKTGLGKTIPDGTKLLSLKVVDGVAYVNFSHEFRENHWGGSAGETVTLYSVINSLTEFDHIKSVQFLVEGEKLESLAGHWYTAEPMKRDEGQIRVN